MPKRWTEFYDNAEQAKWELSHALQDALWKKGWTQSRLAKESGVTSWTIYNIVHGRFLPSLTTIIRLQTALSIEIINIPALINGRMPIYRVTWRDEIQTPTAKSPPNEQALSDPPG